MTEPEFILDSNICIYLLDGSSPAARAHAEQHPPGSLATSAIAYAEVVRGLDLADAAVRRAIDRFFSVVVVLPFDAAAGRAFREVPFERGRFDHLIAAHALSLKVTLVTNNERDFAAVPELRVENWTR